MENKKPQAKYKTIMLIDDNEIDNIINQKMIEGNNFAERIYIHTGSRSALEFLQNLDRDEELLAQMLPDVVFLDINMPIMDGFQFLEEYEKLSDRIKKHCKIVMLTTSINPSDMDRAKKSDYIIRYINKPLTSEFLSDV
ncbi:MAG: response regulator [Bacteroidetes bacterium]|nr:response regulator [Bacteroidota bacterium]